MKVYIFLTNSLGGYSGGPSYVRNKKLWLEKQGWIVIAFDSTGQTKASIDYSELKDYENNRIEELFYHPSWFCEKARERVINSITSRVSIKSVEIVLESNTPIQAEWGEIISKRINAKHLIYLIGENVKISDANEFRFFYHKYIYNELFSISSRAFQSLWGNWLKVEDADKHYWNAMSMTMPQDVESSDLDSLNDSDITITHFGRLKDYMPDVINEVCVFAKNNSEKKINLICYGINKLPSIFKEQLLAIRNIHFYLFDSTFPIPNKLFKISDVVVATAGCAAISFFTGTKTISYNVETNYPLGLMGYTTDQISFCDQNIHENKQTLHEILYDLLINKTYDYSAPLKFHDFDKGYEYHISFINNIKEYYKDVLKINHYKSLNGCINKLFCKSGLVHIASLLRYKRYK